MSAVSPHAAAVNTLVLGDQVVSSLQSAMYHGAENLGVVPRLVKGIIRQELWRERVFSGTGEIVRFESFAAFVTTSTPHGLGTTVKTLQRICGDDPGALDLIDQAIQNPTGVYNVNASRPVGNTSEQAIRRLRKDRPDLHAQVIAGDVSPHAAMVTAGFRPKTVTVRADAEAFARAALRHLAPDDIERLIALLQDGGDRP